LKVFGQLVHTFLSLKAVYWYINATLKVFGQLVHY
jgi:hypothetical protein